MPADASSPASSRGIALDFRQLPWTSRFVCDYCHAFSRVDTFFGGSPRAAGSWLAALAARRGHRARGEVSEALTRQLQARGAPPAAIANAERLRADTAVAVVTGQQAGLFGGPLFTLLKALTAIRLARQIADEHRVPVIPLFWVDAEDHDLDEITSCHLLDADLDPVSVTLPVDAPAGTAAAAIRLDDSIESTVSRLAAVLPPTEFTDEALATLRTAYAPGVRLVEAFARWLDHLLGPHGLVVYDASDPTTKPLVRSVFAHELGTAGETARLAAAAGAEMEANGYDAQVSPAADTVALFRITDRRQPIRFDGRGFRVGEHAASVDTLLADVESDPGSFSPNVLLRPVTQDVLFPTVAYVAGPHELVYLGQLKAVYAAFDVPMPIVYPRASVTVVDSATVKFLNRYDVDFVDLQPQDDGALNALLSAQLPPAVEEAARAAEESVAERLAVVASAVPVIDPTLVGAVESTRGRMERDLRTLRGKIIQAAKRRDETLRRQFMRARALGFPGGVPQERSVGIIYFINRFGGAFVDRLLEDLPMEPGYHQILRI